MPDNFGLSSTDTINRSPALNAPLSQSASPKRAESCSNRARTRPSTSGRRSLLQGLSPSRSLAVASSKRLEISRLFMSPKWLSDLSIVPLRQLGEIALRQIPRQMTILTEPKPIERHNYFFV